MQKEQGMMDNFGRWMLDDASDDTKHQAQYIMNELDKVKSYSQYRPPSWIEEIDIEAQDEEEIENVSSEEKIIQDNDKNGDEIEDVTKDLTRDKDSIPSEKFEEENIEIDGDPVESPHSLEPGQKEPFSSSTQEILDDTPQRNKKGTREDRNASIILTESQKKMAKADVPVKVFTRKGRGKAQIKPPLQKHGKQVACITKMLRQANS